MNRHDELLAWWELGAELSRDLESKNLNHDQLETQYAVDQLDELGEHLLGSKIDIVSPHVEVHFVEAAGREASVFHGLTRGTLNGSYFSKILSQGFLGAYLNFPVVEDDSDIVSYAFVPFRQTTVIPELSAVPVIHEGLREYIDTLVFNEVVKLNKITDLFNDDRSMSNVLQRQACVQYLNIILPLDRTFIEISALQAYKMERVSGVTKAIPIVDVDESIDLIMPVDRNKYFKLYDTQYGKQLGILLPASDTDLFVPCTAIVEINMEMEDGDVVTE